MPVGMSRHFEVVLWLNNKKLVTTPLLIAGLLTGLINPHFLSPDCLILLQCGFVFFPVILNLCYKGHLVNPVVTAIHLNMVLLSIGVAWILAFLDLNKPPRSFAKIAVLQKDATRTTLIVFGTLLCMVM